MSELCASLPGATTLGPLNRAAPDHDHAPSLRPSFMAHHRAGSSSRPEDRTKPSMRLPSFSELVEGVSSFADTAPSPTQTAGTRAAPLPADLVTRSGTHAAPRAARLAHPLPSSSSAPSSPWRPFEHASHAGAPAAMPLHSFEPQLSPFGLAAPSTYSRSPPAASPASTFSYSLSTLPPVEISQSSPPDMPSMMHTIAYEPEPKTWVMPFDSVQSLDDLRDTDGKPRYPYPVLIRAAIMSSPERKLRLQEIYAAIENKYPWFRSQGEGWKNSIRHNLSLIKAFQKVPRAHNEPGKGGYWTVSTVPQGPGPQRFRARTRPRRDTSSSGRRDPSPSGSHDAGSVGADPEPMAAGLAQDYAHGDSSSFTPNSAWHESDRPTTHRFAPVLVSDDSARQLPPLIDQRGHLPAPASRAWVVVPPPLPVANQHAALSDALHAHPPNARRHTLPQPSMPRGYELPPLGRQRADTSTYAYHPSPQPVVDQHPAAGRSHPASSSRPDHSH